LRRRAARRDNARMTDPEASGPAPGARARLRLEIRGAVQGVGFRPTVYRLATELGLAGWVINDARGVVLEVEGARERLEDFRRRLAASPPPHARVESSAATWLEPAAFERFEIRHSDEGGERTVVVLPDLATCPECLGEVLDPRDRRHGYAFANCTHCGPRFTIVRSLPYDRPNTTMAGFTLCAACRAEYDNPLDRRFHAQPTACAACGPALSLWDAAGAVLASGGEALAGAARALREGRIVAVKGLGGFHVLCDAADATAVARLRERKARPEKPFAVMARDLAQARTLCVIDDEAVRALTGAECPIVLLPARADAPVAPGVAPGLATLGVMLPATPLHHLLAREAGRALVATSGNLKDEPIATDEREALARLGHVADFFLVHDRPIERHCDDSVGWTLDGHFSLLRRARGWAPLPVRVASASPVVLAVGPHLKNTVALASGTHVFLSQHIGDLENAGALAAFERVIADFLALYGVAPAAIAHDLHPDYLSTQWAVRAAATRGVPVVPVQHHHAHLAACLAEHRAEGPALGVIWDGTGLGTDGTIWGGEFLLGDAAGFRRAASLRPFRLPGGEAAVREPRRVALALLHACLGDAAFERADLAAVRAFAPDELAVLRQALSRGLHAPVTTSAGRLFDGLAALAGLHPRVTYEGQAAIALEALAEPGDHGAYPLTLTGAADSALELDWRPLVTAALADLARGVAAGTVSARVHAGLAEAIADTAGRVGTERVALSGGCFQNRLLATAAARLLRERGHEVLLHRQVPPNDGGVSLGQAMVARARLAGG
jgi:hydrogenase maturation protein HypF